MLVDDLRAAWYIGLKDLRAYYFKPPNISWGILLPFAFLLAFAIRNPGDLRELVPGLLGLTVLFGTSSMEAIVITFEQRTGSFERLLLAPVRLPALLAGKMLGGMAFGLMVTLAVLVIALVAFGAQGINWPLLILALLLSAGAFAAMGAFVSVSVKEVFEAQTLANFIRFPMMFLGGVFVPLERDAGRPASGGPSPAAHVLCRGAARCLDPRLGWPPAARPPGAGRLHRWPVPAGRAHHRTAARLSRHAAHGTLDLKVGNAAKATRSTKAANVTLEAGSRDLHG